MRLIDKTNPLALVLLLGCALVFVRCDDDDSDSNSNPEGNGVDPIEATVEIGNADQVTEALDIAGATAVEGSAPTPTTTAGTPEIANEDVSVKAAQDGETSITLNYSGESVEGVYFQIDGASSYLDIPISSGGRLLEEDAVTIAIDLVEAFEPGTFCGLICVYDAENRVSSPVTVCIEILELGGENSAFLVGTWELTAVKSSHNNVTTAVGESDEEPGTFQCPNSNETIPYTNIYRLDFVTATFTNKGGATIDGEEYEKELDWNASSCDNLVYKEETDVIDMDGIWTYDDATSRMDMVLNNNEDNEQEVVSFSVVQNGSNIELTFIELDPTDDENETLYFSPK